MPDKKFYTNACPQKCFRLFVALIAVLSAAHVKAQDAPALQWELVNPFRFIHDRDSADELRRVYGGLSADKKTAYDLERELQRLSEEEVKERRAEAGKRFDCNDPKTAGAKRGCYEPYSGWFARLAEDDYRKTCWNPTSHEFRTEVEACRDYIYPRSHRVRVWIENWQFNSQLSAVNAPKWFMDDRPLTEPELKNCDAKYRKAFCVEFLVPYDVDNPKQVVVSARLPDDTTTVAAPVEIVDRLIVGLGDSYAAGEGNPDIPARFTQGMKDKDRLPDILAGHLRDAVKGSLRPQKDADKGAEASWLDQRCHRSMYSYQFKTALLLALANPRQAVTYVSYACSGAKTGQIISEKEKAKEGLEWVDAQLKSLRGVLSNGTEKTREIDYLLLSTGGNDIGFARYVAYALLSGHALKLYETVVNGKKMERGREKGEFKKTLLGKKGNYLKLNEALLGKPDGAKPNGSVRIRIKGCKPDAPCGRILLTPYPDVLTNESRELCKADRKEFDYPFGEDDMRWLRIKTLNTNVFEQIRDIQRREVITGVVGWTVVQGNVNAYAGHGFCAQTSRMPLPLAEKFEEPSWDGQNWTSFDPREYMPYAARTRWIRLPVDAKLTTDQTHTIFENFRLDIFLEDDRSNIMHPTAEGLAKTADENFKEIQKLEDTERLKSEDN